MTVSELENLQGIPNSFFEYKAIVTEHQYRVLVCESAVVSMIGRVLRNVLRDMGFPRLADPWQA